MANIDIIQQGDVAKYQLEIERDDFSMIENDFSVKLSWGLLGQSVEIPKDKMYHDEEWNVFFLFDTSEMLGQITAECEYLVTDSDTESGYRREVDKRLLCFVNSSVCPRFPKKCCKCQDVNPRYVSYTRMTDSDLRTLYLILRADGKEVRTSEEEIVRVRKEIARQIVTVNGKPLRTHDRKIIRVKKYLK